MPLRLLRRKIFKTPAERMANIELILRLIVEGMEEEQARIDALEKLVNKTIRGLKK